MTIDEFVKDLKESPFEWELQGTLIRTKETFKKDGYFPCEKECHCPLTALQHHVSGKQLFMHQYNLASEELGLTSEDGVKVINAADKRGNYDLQLRTRLLEAVGLIE